MSDATEIVVNAVVPERKGSPPTDRVIAIVELLARSREPMLHRVIAERLRLSKSTTWQILTSLERAGWVSKRDARYSIGDGLATTVAHARR
ncbi:helix-turn-helix domain-containing protein [Nocardia sp. NPDC101769]|uniref:helix-turn-helix domain-containing protein n=1 Tax=Nocardia sp. NPDC101769 TaxID=3364333 RepID=UPI0037FA95A6